MVGKGRPKRKGKRKTDGRRSSPEADLLGSPWTANAQVFLETTMFGNFAVMSLADSPILTASLRPIAR